MTCPACSSEAHTTADPLIPVRLRGAVVACRDCGGIYTTRPIYLGDSYAVVLPRWHEGADGDTRYFDLEVLGSGSGRRHGWFNIETRGITQTG